MILVFVLAGTFTAMIAGVTAMIMGQSWWIGVASYVGVGMLTIGIISILSAFILKAGARSSPPRLRAGIPLAEH